MSLPEPIPDFSGRSKKRAKELSPIINLPVNALTDDTDPTRDIRSLIDELHRNAKDGRKRLLESQQENDELSDRLEALTADLAALRKQESEMRSRFVEVTSVIKERDEAKAVGQRHAKTISELQSRLQTLTREHETAQRQKADAVGKLAAAQKSAEMATSQLIQAQAQVNSIRQARDTTHAQNRELREKLARAEDQISDISYGKDSSDQAARKAAEKVAEVQKQLQAIAMDRDALVAQVAELSQVIDRDRSKILALSAEKSQAAAADGQLSTALAEAHSQVAVIAQERDAARARAQEQTRELEELRSQVTALRAEQVDAESRASELEQVRRQLETAIFEREHQDAHEQAMLQEAATQQEHFQEVANQLEAARQAREEALAATAAAEGQIQMVILECEDVKAQMSERVVDFQTRLAATMARNAELERTNAEKEADQSEIAGKLAAAVKHCEEHRLLAVDLGARLDAAQRELIEYTAKLAEARLQVKFAKAGVNPPAPVAQAAPAPEAEETAPASQDLASEAALQPLTEKDARTALTAMRKCHEAFVKNRQNPALLNELSGQAHRFSERARVYGMTALFRLSSALAALTAHLFQNPDALTASSLQTTAQTIDFLTALVRERNVTQLKDPGKGLVFAIEDDFDTCEIIASGLEGVNLKTQYSSDPVAALGELEKTHFDLIFLDINLPGLSGLELCGHIRMLPGHAETPIVFLTALDSDENRVQSIISGGTDFISKPFNLHELSVKALTLILRSQLA